LQVDGGFWRLRLYKTVVADLNEFFAAYLSEYCCNCPQVIARLPEAADESFELVDGIYPGCCHRGAGDIFRLEGVGGGRSHLAPELVAALQHERTELLRREDQGRRGGSYTIRRLADQTLVQGAHCRYFGPRGCTLGVLKGPLCIDFICPPIRDDLLEICCGDSDLIGPEEDFLFIYRTLAAISYENPSRAEAEIGLFRQRLRAMEELCRKFAENCGYRSLFAYFNQEQ